MCRCSIIIPVHNHSLLTQQCLDALLGESPHGIDYDVVVVDDASTDETHQMLGKYQDRIKTVSHSVNTGFATACNEGAAASTGEYLIFLNNDTVPKAGWLEALVAYANRCPDAGVVASKLIFPNGTIQHAGVVICQDMNPRHIYFGFPSDHPAVNKSRRFQVVTAACALIRRQAFEQVGGFDRAFVNGYEDVDLCLRLGQLGYEIHYCHESELYHLESVSRERQSKQQELNYQHYRRRWSERVQPDDVRYYLEDGLLSLNYQEHHPIQISIAPLLGVIDETGREHQVDRLLSQRSRQVLDLLKDNIRLNLRVREAEAKAENILAGGAPTTADSPLADPTLLYTGEARWLSSETSGRLISIILPVKNGAAKLRELLPRIFSQQSDDAVEVIAIDSGSTDDTVEVLRQSGVTVVAIDAKAFNHGLTRNLATYYARGDVFVFMNQSTLPANEHWLTKLVRPLEDDPLIAGVCSRVLPRTDADLLTQKEGLRDPNASAERSTRAMPSRENYTRLKHHQLRLLLNFHTLSAAIRPAVLRHIPFRKVLIGEDLCWAKEVLEAGFKIQHEPDSVIFHSHNYSYIELLQRNVDDGFANREIVGRRLEQRDILPAIIALIHDDWRYIEQLEGLNRSEIESWRLISALRRAAQITGQWIGVNWNSSADQLPALISLTEQIKSGTVPEHAGAWVI